MFKINTDAAAIQSSGGSSFISKSGIYPVTIKFASVDVSTKGAKQVNFNLEYNGNSQTIWGPYVYGKDGSPLNIGLDIINRLCIIAGLRNGETPTIEQETHNVGKDNKPQDFDVITDLSDLECQIRFQQEYYKDNKGEIRSRPVIKAVFSKEGYSAAEIIKSENGESVSFGEDLKKQEKYIDKITYTDVTSEEVEAWLANKTSGNAKPAAKPAAKTVNKPASTLFV